MFSQKKNAENLSFQGKSKAVFIANNKIKAFKQKLEVCKACFHHVSLTASQEYFDEGDDDINGYNVMLCNEIY